MEIILETLYVFYWFLMEKNVLTIKLLYYSITIGNFIYVMVHMTFILNWIRGKFDTIEKLEYCALFLLVATF